MGLPLMEMATTSQLQLCTNTLAHLSLAFVTRKRVSLYLPQVS
jgi:hypothetical protein